MEGERYVFVIDADTEMMIGHWDDARRGQSLRGWLGTDITDLLGAGVLDDADPNGDRIADDIR